MERGYCVGLVEVCIIEAKTVYRRDNRTTTPLQILTHHWYARDVDCTRNTATQLDTYTSSTSKSVHLLPTFFPKLHLHTPSNSRAFLISYSNNTSPFPIHQVCNKNPTSKNSRERPAYRPSLIGKTKAEGFISKHSHFGKINTFLFPLSLKHVDKSKSNDSSS